MYFNGLATYISNGTCSLNKISDKARVDLMQSPRDLFPLSPIQHQGR